MIRQVRILLLIVPLFLATGVYGQFYISSFDTINFPLGDTADQNYPGYMVNLVITNTSANTYIDFFDVMIHADSNLQDTISNPVDTLVSSAGPTPDTLNPGGSLGLVRSNNYPFDPVYFDDGDNIVVIWPVARNQGVVGDTMHTHIYYRRAIGINELSQLPVKIYPNPASEYLMLGELNEIRLKRVRILDSSGKEYYNGIPVGNLIPIWQLAKGNYIVNIESTDGRVRTVQIVKE